MARLATYAAVTLIIGILATGVVATTIPLAWGSAYNISFFLLNKFGTRLQSMVALGAGAYGHIFDIIQTCRSKDGANVDPYECANSVIISAFSMGLAVCTFQSTGTWTKRDTYQVDSVLGRIPDTIKITDVKLLGDPIIANASSSSLLRRQLHEDDEPIHVDYNGSLPLTFVLHHDLGNDTGIVPIFVATDGSGAQIYHIEPINTTDISSNTTQSLKARNGFNGYTHIGTGGIKLQANSDPVANWNDVGNWLNKYSTTGPLYEIVDLTKITIWMGHAFAYSKADGRLDGQFIIEGETVPFGGEWERGWNWCFGVWPTEC